MRYFMARPNEVYHGWYGSRLVLGSAVVEIVVDGDFHLLPYRHGRRDIGIYSAGRAMTVSFCRPRARPHRTQSRSLAILPSSLMPLAGFLRCLAGRAFGNHAAHQEAMTAGRPALRFTQPFTCSIASERDIHISKKIGWLPAFPRIY